MVLARYTNPVLRWLCNHGLHWRMERRYVECGCYQYECPYCGATEDDPVTIATLHRIQKKEREHDRFHLWVEETFHDESLSKREIGLLRAAFFSLKQKGCSHESAY